MVVRVLSTVAATPVVVVVVVVMLVTVIVVVDVVDVVVADLVEFTALVIIVVLASVGSGRGMAPNSVSWKRGRVIMGWDAQVYKAFVCCLGWPNLVRLASLPSCLPPSPAPPLPSSSPNGLNGAASSNLVLRSEVLRFLIHIAAAAAIIIIITTKLFRSK